MQKYIEYLIQDLYAAKMNIAETVDVYNETHKNSTLSSTFTRLPCKNMAEWFGIEQYAFPPFYKLTKQQTEEVNSAIIDLWSVFNIKVIFPAEMSCRDRYTQMVRFWKYKVQYIPNSKWTVDWSTWVENETTH